MQKGRFVTPNDQLGLFKANSGKNSLHQTSSIFIKELLEYESGKDTKQTADLIEPFPQIILQ